MRVAPWKKKRAIVVVLKTICNFHLPSMVKNNLKKASGLGYFLHSDTFLAVLKIENNFQVIASDIESV